MAKDQNVDHAGEGDSQQNDQNKQPYALRGIRRNGDAWDTSLLLFPAVKNDRVLKGFIVDPLGQKTDVLVHINERKPDGEGVVPNNFLTMVKAVGAGADKQYVTLGHGNAVNRRKDKGEVFFDEVLFDIGGTTYGARTNAKISPELHRALGFEQARAARPKTDQTKPDTTAPAPAAAQASQVSPPDAEPAQKRARRPRA